MERRDTKLSELRRRLNDVRADGHRKIIIFTQFRDTMLYLSDRLNQHGYGNIVPLSGQDDPAQGSRAQRIKALRDADAGLLIGTETAAESLNLQFCSAMVNYDIPLRHSLEPHDSGTAHWPHRSHRAGTRGS